MNAVEFAIESVGGQASAAKNLWNIGSCCSSLGEKMAHFRELSTRKKTNYAEKVSSQNLPVNLPPYGC